MMSAITIQRSATAVEQDPDLEHKAWSVQEGISGRKRGPTPHAKRYCC